MKRCSKCKIEKTADEFYKAARARDGLKHQCKVCHLAGCADWAKRNTEKVRAIHLRSHNKHKAARLAVARDWKKRNWDRTYAVHRKWVARNPERFNELCRPHRLNWKRNNPEAVLEQGHRRRTRLAGAEGSYDPGDIKRLYAEQHGLCANPNCAADLSAGFHRDHRVSIANGGSNFIENIQLLCGPCNTKKRSRSMLVLMASTRRNRGLYV